MAKLEENVNTVEPELGEDDVFADTSQDAAQNAPFSGGEDLENGEISFPEDDEPGDSEISFLGGDEPEDGEISFSGDEESEDGVGGDDYMVKQKKRKKRRIITASVILAVIVAAVGAGIINHIRKNGADDKEIYTDAAVERRTVMNTITGSSSIEPNDSYNVISMHSGDITADYISEGSTVKKGDKLYQFDDEDARNQLTSAKNSLTKAQQQYTDAVKAKSQTEKSNSNQTQSARNSVERALNSLDDARTALDDRYVTSDIHGKVSAVYVSDGDEVQNGAQIADVYDDSIMKLRLPFNEFDAESVYEGAPAEVSVAGASETIPGTVTEVASAATASDAHTIVVYATIEVTNPGALTVSDTGSAVVNDAACADAAQFEYADTQTITAAAAGTLMDFDIAEGDVLYEGERIAYIDSAQLETAYDNAKLSYDDAVLSLERQVLNNDTYSQDSNIKSAQLALEDARLQVENAQKSVDDFVVEAPIDGTVVTKNAKSGDTIDSTNGGNTDPLCVIYDLSCVKFSIDVDETEVALVKVGQKATVTADAVEGEFEGRVVKVPVDGVNENGVTTYTIDVQIDNYGDLLPGMNIDAEIVVEEASDVLTVPVNSVNRGNIVFVKDTGTPHENDVTDRLSAEDAKNNDKDRGKDAETEENTAGTPGNQGGMPAPDNDNTSGGGRPANMPDGRNGTAGSGSDNTSGGGLSGDAGPSGGAGSSGDAAAPRDTADRSGSGIDALMANLPKNIEVPEGYRAIVVETGINDSDYIEIKTGLNEGDMVRTLNTETSSAGASFGDTEAMPGGGMGGGMPGGGMGGGMPGGGMPGGGMGGGR